MLLYIILLCIQFGDSTTYKFVLYNLSKDMLCVNFLKFLLYLLTRISLLMGHFSVRSTAAFSLFRSCSNSSQSYIVWSIVCSPFLHEHVGLSLLLYLFKYDLILPCPVTNVAKLGRSDASSCLISISWFIRHWLVCRETKLYSRSEYCNQYALR